MRAFALFACASLVAMGIVGALLTIPFSTPAERQALIASGVIAFAVQLFSYAIARGMRGSNVMAGWGLGMLLRFVTLAVYALAILRAFGLAPTAALMSMATFFFVSTLIEPWLLKA